MYPRCSCFSFNAQFRIKSLAKYVHLQNFDSFSQTTNILWNTFKRYIKKKAAMRERHFLKRYMLKPFSSQNTHKHKNMKADISINEVKQWKMQIERVHANRYDAFIGYINNACFNIFTQHWFIQVKNHIAFTWAPQLWIYVP